MFKTPKTLITGLLSVTLLAGNLPLLAQAETMWVPRLGYTVKGPKKIYLDITTPELRETEEKARKEEEKAARGQMKETQKALKALKKEQKEKDKETEEQGKADIKAADEAAAKLVAPVTEIPSAASAAKDETQPEFIDPVEPREKSRKKAKAEKAEKKDRDKKARQQDEKLEKADKSDKKDKRDKKDDAEAARVKSPKEIAESEARRKAQLERAKRQKARMMALRERHENMPVDGVFYLYNLKQDRLLFKQASKLQYTDAQAVAGPYYVEFKDGLTEGIFDLAVRGSGHRSEKPVWVSDGVYWDALQPVLEDVGKAHCPPSDGKHFVLQQCYMMQVNNPMTSADVPEEQRTILVKGGWFVDNPDTRGVVKSTPYIADIAQVLLHVYQTNPKSYKYLLLSGDSYTQSPFPDVLDEINWGMQYLLSIQQPDGSFPQGVAQIDGTGKRHYRLLPASPESTARSVMTLATAVRSFKDQDLSLAVKMMRAAERGWRSLEPQLQTLDPQLQLLVSYAMTQVSDNNVYAQALAQARSQVRTLTPKTALLLGAAASEFEVPTTTEETGAEENSEIKTVTEMIPLLAQAAQDPKASHELLARSVTELFGYEKITLIRDPRLVIESSPYDPLQWVANKTGEFAMKLGHRFEDSGITRPETKLDSKHLKALEEKEAEVRQRAKAGYRELSLGTLEKAHLAYALAMLNQQMAFDADPEVRQKQQEPEAPTFSEPIHQKKGHYPKEI